MVRTSQARVFTFCPEVTTRHTIIDLLFLTRDLLSMVCADQSPIYYHSREPSYCPGSLMLQLFMRSYMSLRYQRARGSCRNRPFGGGPTKFLQLYVDFVLLYLKNSKQRQLHVLVYMCV
jgi:hypothetical protein